MKPGGVLGRLSLLPRVIALAAQAPRDPAIAWRRYWSGVERTGDDGNVLWDRNGPDELARYRELTRRYLSPGPVLLDLGCGNGRFTRGLARPGRRVIGVDVAEAAIDRARAELLEQPGGIQAEYRQMDITDPAAAQRLRDELGECHVFVRGVLHVLDRSARRQVGAVMATLLGSTGVAVVAETNHRGGSLAYLAGLGATPGSFPEPLARAVAGLPRPRHFGAAELADTFPTPKWELLTAQPTDIGVLPMGAAQQPTVPGYLAVLRLRRGASEQN